MKMGDSTMAKRTLRRNALIGSASLLALAFGASGPTMAQTQTDVTIDLLGLNVSGTISAVNGNPINDVGSQGIIQDPVGSSLSIGVTNNSIAGDVYLDITPGSTVANGNLIFAAASGNTFDNSVGILPASADGIAILQGQVADGFAIRGHSNGDQIIQQIFDNGNGSAEFNSNSIFVDAAVNRSLNTIEVDSRADLTIPADAGYLDSGLPSSQQQASLSIVNVQLSTNFDSADVPGGPIADLTNATVQFNRETDAGLGGELLTGTFNLTGNSIKSTANGNTSDNSVLVGDGGAPNFGGTAFVTNLQASDDSNEVGIGAQVAGDGNSIAFEFRQDAFGGADIGGADGLMVTVADNLIASRAVVNNSRNEVSFDGDLSLQGVLVEPSQQIIRLTDRAPDRVEADYAAINIQAASSLLGGTIQGAYALTESASISLSVENVVDTSSLTFDGNGITATAGGNSALNIVGNGAGGTASSVSAVAASLNYQLLDTPLIDATVDGALLLVNIGVAPDGSTAFGGLENSPLSFSGNAIKAAGFGNAGQSDIDFQGTSLTLQFSDNGGVDPNDGANLNSNNGEAADDGDYRVSGGASTLSYQLLSGAVGTDPAVTAAVENSSLQLLVNGYSFPNLASAPLANTVIVADGNQLSASAVGNSFNGNTTLDGLASVTGSAGTLAYQGATGQSVAADLLNSGLDVFLGYAPAEGANDVTLSVSENLLLSFASINALSTSVTVTTLDLDGGADGNAANARIYGSLDLNQIAGRNRARGDASLTILSDQVNGEGGASAEARDVFLAVQLIDMGDGSSIADAGITVDANTILAQSRGNQAANVLEIDAQSASNAQEGALAGIVSQQVNATTAAPTVDLNDPEATAASLVYAGAYGNAVTVNLNNLDSGTLSVQQNRILANAAANSVSNNLAVNVTTSLDLATSSTTGADLAVSVVGTTSDVQLDITASGAYILNAQRNEALDPGAANAPDAAGPAVLAIVGSSAPSPANSIVVNLGVTDGNAVVGSTLSSGVDVNTNGILATARANDASNTLGLDIGNGAANGGILNNQINSGAIVALNDGSSITTNLLGDGNDSVFVNMNGNQIGASSLGNNASNQLTAAAATGFAGVAGSTGPVATIPAGTGVLINNGALDATGNLVVLNTQTSYGVTGFNQSSATTSNASIALNADAGATLGSAIGFSNNSIGATVGANTASNSIVASAGVGDLPSATILSVQKSSGQALSASVSDSTISATLGDVGGGGGYSGSLTMSGNKIGATGSINSGSNTISAPGQTFTRTSTF